MVEIDELTTDNLASRDSVKYSDLSAFDSLCSIERKLFPPKKLPCLSSSKTI